MAGYLKNLFIGKQAAKEEIEEKRKKGQAMTGSEMSSTHQEALRALTAQPKKDDTPTSPLEEEAKRRKGLGQKNYK